MITLHTKSELNELYVEMIKEKFGDQIFDEMRFVIITPVELGEYPTLFLNNDLPNNHAEVNCVLPGIGYVNAVCLFDDPLSCWNQKQMILVK